MIQSVVAKIFGTRHDREMKKLAPLVAHIASLEPKFKALTDEQIREKTAEFKSRIAKGESVDSVLPEAFANCREGSVRSLSMRHYDVQMIGGMVLNKGSIAEMRTGEGKTLTATLESCGLRGTIRPLWGRTPFNNWLAVFERPVS